MIGKAAKSRSFRALLRRLACDPARVVWTRGYHLLADAPLGASREMDAVAAGKDRCKTPAFYLPIYWHPDDAPTQAEMEITCQRVLERLGLQEHQAYLVARNDKPHACVHIVANRVHHDPARRVWDGWKDGRHAAYRLIESELRALEQEMGWAVTPGRHARVAGRAPGGRRAPGSWYAWRGRQTFEVLSAEELRAASSWGALRRLLAHRDMRMEARAGGVVITDGRWYTGAGHLPGLEGGSPALEARFGQSLDDFLATRPEEGGR